MELFSYFRANDVKYQTIPLDEDVFPRSLKRTPILWSKVLVAFILSLGFLLLGLLLGRISTSSPESIRSALLQPCGNIQETWHHDATFSGPPTPEAEDAWASLIPPGRGFIYQPEVSPEAKSIAIFHQLHCLHGLRVAFYGMYHELEIANGSTPDAYLQDQLAKVSVGHLRHCFDYLRRALMCAADTNLEYVNPETDSTTGWGYPRMCRDFESVKEFAGIWKNSTDRGII